MANIFETIRKSLALAGATPADVMQQRIFVVALKLEHRPLMMQAMMAPQPCSEAETSLSPDATGGECLYICRGFHGL